MIQVYDSIIKDQKEKGFIEEINDDDGKNDVHYIPHHAVKKDSLATPIRIVFDCSCKESKGSPSLND